MNIDVAAADGSVQIRQKAATGDWGAWGSQVAITLPEVQLQPISSFDGVNFFSATFDPLDNSMIKSAAVTGTALNESVLSVDLQLGTTGTEEITVDLGTSAIGAASAQKDIHRASRVAIFVDSNNDGTYETSNIWYYVDGKSEDTTNAIKAASGATYFKAYNATDYTDVQVLKANDEIQITIPAADNNVPVPVTVKLVLWIEGQDADCVTSNAGASFDVGMLFAKVSETEDGE